MPLRLDANERAIEERAREIASRLLSRAALFEQEEQIPKEVYVELGRAGLMGLNVPKSLGGAEAGPVAFSLAMTRVAEGCAATAVAMAVTNMVGEILHRFGSPEQQERYCRPLCAGAHGAFALSEAEAGSDPTSMRTRAELHGGEWILNGSKQWISHADTSEVLVVWARTPSVGERSLSAFLVDGDAAGLSIGGVERKMGLRASHTCALVFDEVRVPGSALLGEVGRGMTIAMAALDGGRIGIASQALGVANAVASTLRDASATGLWKPSSVADLAEPLARVEAARQLTLRAAWLKAEGHDFTQEASMAKVFATEATWHLCSAAHRLAEEVKTPHRRRIERALRDIRVARIYEGTSEIQRLVIARSLLRSFGPAKDRRTG